MLALAFWRTIASIMQALFRATSRPSPSRSPAKHQEGRAAGHRHKLLNTVMLLASAYFVGCLLGLLLALKGF